MKKKWFLSKTIWVNALMIISSFLAPEVLTAETQLKILAVVNIVLRWVTKEEVTW